MTTDRPVQSGEVEAIRERAANPDPDSVLDIEGLYDDASADRATLLATLDKATRAKDVAMDSLSRTALELVDVEHERDEAVEKTKSTYCAYCGWRIALVDTDAAGQVEEHIRTCSKHPMSLLQAELGLVTRDRDSLRRVAQSIDGLSRYEQARQLDTQNARVRELELERELLDPDDDRYVRAKDALWRYSGRTIRRLRHRWQWERRRAEMEQDRADSYIAELDGMRVRCERLSKFLRDALEPGDTESCARWYHSVRAALKGTDE